MELIKGNCSTCKEKKNLPEQYIFGGFRYCCKECYDKGIEWAGEVFKSHNDTTVQCFICEQRIPKKQALKKTKEERGGITAPAAWICSTACKESYAHIFEVDL